MDTDFARAERERVVRLADAYRQRGAAQCELALVLGSGLGGLLGSLSNAEVIPGGAFDELPRSRVPGHAGRIVLGELAGVRVFVQAGRVHLYEGWNAYEVTRSVRACIQAGVSRLVLSNAAGSLRRGLEPGALMRIEDHLNLQGRTPLWAGEGGRGRAYDPGLARALEAGAAGSGLVLEHGVYAAVPGPSYESAAEVRRLARMGADAVGMSTVLEACAARACGAAVAAVSGITNFATGVSDVPPSHEEVLDVGRVLALRLAQLLEASVDPLCAVGA